MSSRLDELRRQRALLQEHLAWLDREIAAAAGTNSPSAPAPAPKSFVPPPALPSNYTAPAPEADPVLAQLRVEQEKQTAPPPKAGCWMIFWAILLLGGGILGGLIYFFYR